MAEKKKILYIVEAMGGGVFTYIVDLANELVNKYDMYIAYAVRKQTPKNYKDYAKSNLIDKSKLHTHSAGLIILPSQKLTWGGVSQIYVILDLITEALKTEHDYYHLISGVDLPLKNNYDMAEFFKKNKGKEFIGITPEWAESPGIAQRYKLHWFFQDNIGKKKNILYFVSRVITKVEKHIGFKREKGEDIHFFGGPEWFSITEQAARYILSQGDWAKKRFRETICSDEIYAQTIIGNSPFAEEIYNKESKDSYAECLRYAKFNRESPFVLNVKDYDNLVDMFPTMHTKDIRCLHFITVHTTTMNRREMSIRQFHITILRIWNGIFVLCWRERIDLCVILKHGKVKLFRMRRM